MSAKLLLNKVEKVQLSRCEAIRHTTYYTDTSETNKRCVRLGIYEIEGKCYCKLHAGIVSLEISLK